MGSARIHEAVLAEFAAVRPHIVVEPRTDARL
jgi:hypothetical protein